jgi:hypothetical protein
MRSELVTHPCSGRPGDRHVRPANWFRSTLTCLWEGPGGDGEDLRTAARPAFAPRSRPARDSSRRVGAGADLSLCS